MKTLPNRWENSSKTPILWLTGIPPAACEALVPISGSDAFFEWSEGDDTCMGLGVGVGKRPEKGPEEGRKIEDANFA